MIVLCVYFYHNPVAFSWRHLLFSLQIHNKVFIVADFSDTVITGLINMLMIAFPLYRAQNGLALRNAPVDRRQL